TNTDPTGNTAIGDYIGYGITAAITVAAAILTAILPPAGVALGFALAGLVTDIAGLALESVALRFDGTALFDSNPALRDGLFYGGLALGIAGGLTSLGSLGATLIPSTKAYSVIKSRTAVSSAERKFKEHSSEGLAHSWGRMKDLTPEKGGWSYDWAPVTDKLGHTQVQKATFSEGLIKVSYEELGPDKKRIFDEIMEARKVRLNASAVHQRLVLGFAADEIDDLPTQWKTADGVTRFTDVEAKTLRQIATSREEAGFLALTGQRGTPQSPLTWTKLYKGREAVHNNQEVMRGGLYGLTSDRHLS
ncbi:hypothetical protein, partial [Streptomyces sp. NPDC057910]|uniref:hypothetical protein n=1 Tax=Streptomyces sp. NPDC057910 TaxID=3346278 RepID=UPI0036E857D6